MPSGTIASVGYDRATNVLELEYANGGIYRYFAVPPSVHAALMTSTSIGAFVNEKIKPRHACSEIDPED